MTSIAGRIVTILGVTGLYFLFAGEISGAEGIAVLPVIVLVLVYVAGMVKARSVPMQIRMRGLRSILRGFGGVSTDSWRVGRGLVRAVWRRPEETQGVIAHVPLRYGGIDGEDVGRRASVVVGLSLAPNGFVVGMDRERDTLIVHQLVPDPVGGDREWPV